MKSYNLTAVTVSIQLVSPASGENRLRNNHRGKSPFVSIQLVSPASGEAKIAAISEDSKQQRFHSISFPSEWGACSLSSQDA